MLLSLAVLQTALGAVAGGAEIIVQNDSVPPGTPLPTFLPGERVAAWLTSPISGNIVGVQVWWDSQLGGNPAQMETAITVSAAGAFPTPGAALATVVGPTLSDGVLNEFRHLDPPTNLIPLSVPVAAGQTFVVDLEFFNQSSGNPLASSIEIDNDGITPGRNSVFVLPGGWMDAGPLGVTGDWGIRAIIVPEPSSAVLLVVGLAALAAARHWSKTTIR
jgi:hypothetical protein